MDISTEWNIPLEFCEQFVGIPNRKYACILNKIFRNGFLRKHSKRKEEKFILQWIKYSNVKKEEKKNIFAKFTMQWDKEKVCDFFSICDWREEEEKEEVEEEVRAMMTRSYDRPRAQLSKEGFDG